MKVWHKILIPPVLAILFLLAVGAISVALMARQGMAINTLIKNRGGSMTLALTVFQVTGRVQSSVYRNYITSSMLGTEKLKEATEAHHADLNAVLKRANEYVALPNVEPEERELVQAALVKFAAYRGQIDTVMANAIADPDSAMQALRASDQTFQEIGVIFTKMHDLQSKLAAESSAQGAADFRNMLIAILGIAVLAAAAALAAALLMARHVVRPLRDATRVAGEIARGDLGTEITVQGKDETAELLAAQARMQEDLRRLVTEVVTGARGVADTSAQIAQGNVDLSQRTEEQASTLEETASSMEELTATVHQNAENARQASQLAIAASDVARKGGQVVGAVVSTMTGISDSSRKISDIIGVIDGIAFQTNILALNAAVEAARAGEQGRGFAVVAAEVRSLAQRSATAAKEIKTLIADSVDKVDTGTRLVDSAGQTMEEIVASVKKVSDLISEIAAASQEQSSGIAQVNTAVTQMDQVVQQNASLVEEATAATESMKEQAASLLRTVSRFRLGGEAAAVVENAGGMAPIRFQPRAQLAGGSAALPEQRGDSLPTGEWRTF